MNSPFSTNRSIAFLTVCLSVPLWAAPPIPLCTNKTQRAEGVELETQFEDAVKAGDMPLAASRWEAMKVHPCYRLLLLENFREPEFDDAHSAQRWLDQGADQWLRRGPETPDSVILPPDWPTPFRSKSQAIADLACPSKDFACGAETVGWVMRAQEAFTHAPKENDQWVEGNVVAQCTKVARKATHALKYPAFRMCLEDNRPVFDTFPEGRWKAPVSGYWVVRGRRGHYNYCEEVRVFDLATGAVFLAQRCSKLSFVREFAEAAGVRVEPEQLKVSVGRVSVELLREAAFMAFLADSVEKNFQRKEWKVYLPVGLRRTFPSADAALGQSVSVGGLRWSSNQTSLHWTWQGSADVRATGQMSWPYAYETSENHVTKLLQIAEASFVPGGSPVDFPKVLFQPPTWHSDLRLDSTTEAVERAKIEAEVNKKPKR